MQPLRGDPGQDKLRDDEQHDDHPKGHGTAIRRIAGERYGDGALAAQVARGTTPVVAYCVSGWLMVGAGALAVS